MVVCEGEFEVGWEALRSLLAACKDHDLELFFLDDGSPSRVGRRLAERLKAERELPTECIELEKSLGFRGSAVRAFTGLAHIARSGKAFDAVIKIDADALVLREDLGAFIAAACRDGRGLFGEQHAMRARDRVLYAADQLPAGFTREVVDGTIQRRWRLSRLKPVWWADLGRKALLNGFKFQYIPGCFWFLGGQTLAALDAAGHLRRDQATHGFVFNDDLLLTTAVLAIGHPIVDLATLSPSFGGTMGMSERTPLDEVLRRRPFVVHPLKNNPQAWQRRQELRTHFPALVSEPAPTPS
jgi:hypothetical protein